MALFRTAGGTTYSFQLHVSAEKDAVAHAVCIGPTGSGKTTVMTFLAAMALRHPKLRAYIFDRYQGAYVFFCGVSQIRQKWMYEFRPFRGAKLPLRRHLS